MWRVTCYIGQWEEGEYHGYGKLYRIGKVDHGPKGTIWEGHFDQGEFFADRTKTIEYNAHFDQRARKIDFAKYGQKWMDTKWP